jgi:hypothetical protein
VVATLLILASSGNVGTGFGLPLIAVTIVLCAVVVGTSIELRPPVLAAFVALLLVVGCASQFTTSMNPWWHGPPYRLQELATSKPYLTNLDQLTAQVAASLGRGEAIEAVNSGVLNTNGLFWYLTPSTNHLYLPPGGPGVDGQIISRLPETDSLVTGTAQYPFDPFINETKIEKAAWRSGLHPARIWNVTKNINVVLWSREPSTVRRSVLAPSVLLPRDGSVLTAADRHLVAAPPKALVAIFGVQKVSFLIAGATLSHPLVTVAMPYPYGWFAPLNVSTLTKGRYTVTCLVQYMDGIRTSSRATTVYVK